MFTTKKSLVTSNQSGRLSVGLAMLLTTSAVAAMAWTLAPQPSAQAPMSALPVSADSASAFAPTGEVDLSGSMLSAPTAKQDVATVRRVQAGMLGPVDLSAFTAQEPLSIDHSTLNNPDLLPASNPAPLAVAAYE